MKIKFVLTSFALITANAFAIKAQLMVGSSFDYPPLTYMEDGKYKGFDITLIRDFAKDNHFSLQLVKTSWPNLTRDLLANKFILAIGGISDNPERRKIFLMSDPINVTRKAALIRCRDIDKFKTLSDIDTKGIRVVENNGGTNKQFAIEHIKKASIIIASDNQLPFTYLLTNKADVMFTDDIEIHYKHNQNPSFCMAKLDTQFPGSNKVVLFTNNSIGKQLQLQFNKWWQHNKTNYSFY